MVDLLVGGAAAEYDARHAVAPAGAGLFGEHRRVLARVDPFDLPDVHLDSSVLTRLDHAAHQFRAQLGVIAVGVAVDLGELIVGCGH